jgi:hypothetical protein
MKVAVIHELPLRKNKVFGYILRKSCSTQIVSMEIRSLAVISDKDITVRALQKL